MRRIVGQMTGSHPASGPRASGLGLASSLLLALGASSVGGEGDDDGPELTRPSEMPAVSRPIVSKPANPQAIPARPSSANRGGPAVLAVPGLTRPSARPSPLPEPAEPALDPGPGGLTLDAPIEMRRAPEATPGGSNDVPRRSSLPLVLESAPMDEPSSLGPMPSRTGPSTKRPTPTPRPSTQPAPAQARRPRFFGLIPGAAPSAGPSPTRGPTAGRASVEDVRDDPAAESALKRRIEKQARDAVGDRARSIEVKVVGKDAVVHARGVKFLQKRSVRKSLESIPALSGVRSTIEVVD